MSSPAFIKSFASTGSYESLIDPAYEVSLVRTQSESSTQDALPIQFSILVVSVELSLPQPPAEMRDWTDEVDDSSSGQRRLSELMLPQY